MAARPNLSFAKADSSEPTLREVKRPARQEVPADLQKRAEEPEEARVNVRLYIDSSDADGIRHFDELMAVSLVRAILNPNIADFFIPIQGTGRLKPAMARGHWLHTSYIREVLLLQDLPEGGDA